MVQHVSVGNQSVCFVVIDLDAEDPACDHHTHFTVLLEWELRVLRHLLANQIVVLLDVLNLGGYLLLEWRTIEPGSLFV